MRTVFQLGAKFTGTNFAPDEFVQPTIDHSFDGKRDRWNGYDNQDYKVNINIVKGYLPERPIMPPTYCRIYVVILNLSDWVKSNIM